MFSGVDNPFADKDGRIGQGNRIFPFLLTGINAQVNTPLVTVFSAKQLTDTIDPGIVFESF